MKLVFIENINDEDWDRLINNFGSRSLFHQSAWLKFLEETRPGAKIIKFKITENNETVGYFTGFIEKKGLFKIFSTPRQGCNTPHMGPIFNNNQFDQQKFIDALDNFCKSEKIDQLEISSPCLNSEMMIKNNFKCREGVTYIVKLGSGEEMWKNLDKKSCRYTIHKAEKNRLLAEDTSDPQIIEEYYKQLKEVFGKQKLVPTYPKERVLSLFNCLKSKDLLFSLQVKYENKIIATGFFPHNNKTVYFFGGASWLKYHYLCPNDLLHWTLMKIASNRGIKEYDMEGAGSFKPKFGGKEIKIYRWYKSYNPLAKIARSIYQFQFKILQKIKGFNKKL